MSPESEIIVLQRIDRILFVLRYPSMMMKLKSGSHGILQRARAIMAMIIAYLYGGGTSFQVQY